MNFEKKDIDTGISLISVKSNRFKTNEASVSFALPLDRDCAAANALMINLLSRRSAKYENLTELNRKLAMLYGATLEAEVSKIGECQVLGLGITSLDDRFSLDGGSISLQCIELLISLIFQPKLVDGLFCDEDIESEKRILIEKIEAEGNEKRLYVLRQTEKLMFENEPYGINKYGTVEDVKALTSKEVTAAWENMLKSAKIMATVVGSADADAVCHRLKNAFSEIKREFKEPDEPVFVPECKTPKEHFERIDVKQGKLVLGYRINLRPDDPLTPAMRSFCDIFGGGPYSKLFVNVREKLSLCYYCSARYTRLKSMIMVQCGCNEENMDKAVSEISSQLEAIKNGDFSEEFNSSKIAVTDAIMSVNDAPEAIEAWYVNQIADSAVKSPEQSAAENNSVTPEQIKQCAKLLTLDTVYKLSSPGEVQ